MIGGRHRCVEVDAAGVCVMIALSVGAYFTTVAPAFKGQQAKASLAQRLEDETTAGEQLGAAVTRLQHQVDNMKQQIAETTITLRPSTQQNERVGLISQTASEAGLVVSVLQPRPAVAYKRYGIVSITLEGTGSYSQTTTFLMHLAKTFRDVGVKSIDLTGSPGAGGPSLVFHIELSWYIAPTEPAG
jgi:Tfp pilus assembly protein PilO